VAEAATAQRLAAIRAEVDALLMRQGGALWELWTTGKLPSPEPALEASAALASTETIAFVRGERDRAEGDERRSLALLHGFLVGEHLSRATAAARAPSRPAVPWDGSAVPPARVPSLLAGEADPGRRAALERAWADAARRSAKAEAPRLEAMAAGARALGHASLLTLAAELRGAEPEALVVLAEAVIATTDAAYRTLLDALARLELGVGLAEVRGGDLPRLLRAGDDPRSFPAARAGADVQQTLSTLGLGLAGRDGVLLDAEARPGKDPRALALPVKVPDGVRLATTPASGAAALRAVLHEAGAAAFYAHVTTSVLEFRRLGTATAEAWATLFEDLAGDPAWLADRTGLSESHLAPLVRALAARRLHEARSLAARILVEVARARDPAHATAAAQAALRWAFARPVGADELDVFLAERDPLLESVESLRAVLLGAQAEAHLASLAEAPWWRASASGARLRELFADGSRLPAADLARALGASGIDAGAFAAEAMRRAAAAGLRVAVVP
jgi:hypothetical protein